MHAPCPCHYSSCFPLNSIFGFFELRNMWNSVEFCRNCQPRMNRRTRGMRWRSVLDGQFQSARSAERLIFSTIQKDASAFNMYICQMTAWWMGKSTKQKRWGFSFTSGFAERCPLFSADLREERIRLGNFLKPLVLQILDSRHIRLIGGKDPQPQQVKLL